MTRFFRKPLPRGGTKAHRALPPPASEPDPLDHPDLRGLGPRALADLPLPRPS